MVTRTDRVVITFEKGAEDACVGSTIRWELLKPFLEQAFRIRENERLVSLEVTVEGIHGKFKTIPSEPIPMAAQRYMRTSNNRMM